MKNVKLDEKTFWQNEHEERRRKRKKKSKVQYNHGQMNMLMHDKIFLFHYMLF